MKILFLLDVNYSSFIVELILDIDTFFPDLIFILKENNK